MIFLPIPNHVLGLIVTRLIAEELARQDAAKATPPPRSREG